VISFRARRNGDYLTISGQAVGMSSTVIFDAVSLISDRVVVIEQEFKCQKLSRELRFFSPSKLSNDESAIWDESNFVQSEVKLRRKRKHSTVGKSTGFDGVTFASPSRCVVYMKDSQAKNSEYTLNRRFMLTRIDSCAHRIMGLGSGTEISFVLPRGACQYFSPN
jgi:hypothetical protein